MDIRMLARVPMRGPRPFLSLGEIVYRNSLVDMTLNREAPPRQPLFWAAIVFSLGLWIGVRAWRPPAWWMVAIVAFALAALWFLSRRAWLARCLALAAWFLFGAFLIQIRGRPAGRSYIFSRFPMAVR